MIQPNHAITSFGTTTATPIPYSTSSHTIFPNASCAVGLIDRLTHHAAIVKIAGGSYRLREAEQTQKRRRAS